MTDSPHTYEQIQEAAQFIQESTKTTAKVAVITGTALGVMPKCCVNGTEITCSKIPNVGECAEDDCSQCPNSFYSGNVGSTPVIALAGRPYVVNASSLPKTSVFIKTLKLIGIETVILICPAGALNPDYKVGDIMVVKDHINFMGLAGYNPLLGKNDERFGPKFFGVDKIYNEQLRSTLINTLKENNYEGQIHEGVYVAITGPAFPTSAEKQFLRVSNADAVGMYLTPEVLLARHCGLNVVAMCIITEEFSKPDTMESNFENVGVIDDKKLEVLNSCVEKMITQLDDRPAPQPTPPPEVAGAAEPSVKGVSEIGDTEKAKSEKSEAVSVKTAPLAKDNEVDAQSTLTAGPCCRCAVGANVTDAITLPYGSIPNFPPSKSTVGDLIAGKIGETPVIIMCGRYPCFEEFTEQQCTMHIRVLKLLGVQHVVIIDTAGGLNQDYKAGDVMLIVDHINFLGFSGRNPLTGPNDDRFGPRLLHLKDAYDKELLAKAKEAFADINVECSIREGTYGVTSGPACRTPLEYLLIRKTGVDAIGNVVGPEVMVARHCGMIVLAFAVITDIAIFNEDDEKETSQQEVDEICSKRGEELKRFLEKYVQVTAAYQAEVLSGIHTAGGGTEHGSQYASQRGDDQGGERGSQYASQHGDEQGSEHKSKREGAESDVASAGPGSTAPTANAATVTKKCCKCKKS